MDKGGQMAYSYIVEVELVKTLILSDIKTLTIEPVSARSACALCAEAAVAVKADSPPNGGKIADPGTIRNS